MFFWIFLSLYVSHLALSVTLECLNLSHLKKHKDKIPDFFETFFSIETYRQSIAYSQIKTKFGFFKTGFDVIVLWTLILTGGFHLLDLFVGKYFSGIWHSTFYLFCLGALFYLLSLPFSLYHQFSLEESFGFNKTSYKTFILDQMKSVALSLVIGIPFLSLIFWLVQTSGSYWWLLTWGVLLAFQFLMAALFPVLIAPIFYKFTPLPDGELKDHITTLAKKINFKMAGIYTIDGSKRSGHSNAFFAGIGKTRRIVLYDTLIKQLTTSQLVSVLAHEMGHNIKKHVIKHLVLSAVTSLLGLFALHLLLHYPSFYQAFGVPTPSVHVGFFIFGILYSVFTFPFEPFGNWISRKHEYEADHFSVEINRDKESMIRALVNLSKENLSNLTPHPWYSFFYYSHPTTLERAKSIEEISI